MGERLNRSVHSKTEQPDIKIYEKERELEQYPEEKLHAQAIEHTGVKELSKNKLETKICNDILTATRRLLADLKLGNIGKSIDLDPGSVHLLSEEDARVLYPEGYGVEGWHNLGGVYILRMSDRVEFARILSHEISHYISYLETSFKHETDVLEEPPKFEYPSTGVAYFEKNEINFKGIMEAATELLAVEIRKRFIELGAIFDLREENDLKSEGGYTFQVRLLEYIIRDVASTNQEYDDWQKQLFKDHIVGTTVFLNQVKNKLPEAYALLKNMGTDPTEVLTIAQKLGYTELADEVERYLTADDNEKKENTNRIIQEMVTRFKKYFPDDYTLLKQGGFNKNFIRIWDKKKDRWALRELKDLGEPIPNMDNYNFQHMRLVLSEAIKEDTNKL